MNAARAFAVDIALAIVEVLETNPVVAKRLRAALGGEVDFSQDALPPNMTKRAYLEHCARGHWPSKKMGRLRVTSRADFDAWAKTKVRRVLATADGEPIVDGEAYLLAMGARPSKARGR